MKRILSICTLCLLVAACSTNVSVRPDKTAPKNQPKTAEERTKKLVTLTKWDIRGQIGVSDGKEAWSAQVNWQQRGNKFSMQMYGPFAGGSMKINGSPGNVTMTDASSKRSKAASADELFAKQTGWNLPISDMLYWIKAAPAPGKPAKEQYDEYNHLTNLQQQGWDITYSRYTSDKGVDLPSKVQMINKPLKIKIIISDWKLLS